MKCRARVVYKFKLICNDYYQHLNRIEFYLLILICWAFVWPLRYPNWITYGYNSVPETQIASDLSSCELSSNSNQNKSFCTLFSQQLVSTYNIMNEINDSLIEAIPLKYDIKMGGTRRPWMCSSQQRVAIIVPYRNRSKHLRLFTQHIHPFLSQQLIEYTIFVINQNDTNLFNRGLLFNIGFVEANQMDSFCCFIFHDIDLLPQNQKQLYYCSKSPRHMCSALDKFRYNLLYPHLFGGVIAITKQQYQSVNGYSNQFSGWGGEDDDFYNRIKAKNLLITRWEPYISRCVMLTHKTEKPNPNRMNLLREGSQYYDSDGLNDVRTKYQLLSVNKEKLYTLINVRLF